MRHNGGRRPDEILAEIERTRSDMDATLSAIEHRLTPGQLVDQGIDYLRHSGANEFVHNLGGSVKQNPLPVALVSIGLAWLMAAGKKPGDYDYETDFGPSTTDKLRSRASDTLSRASSTMDSAKQSLTQTAQSMRERASSVGESARQQMDRAKGGMDYMLREQPLALGAIGLAIGAVVAAMAPRTRKEDELMGEARDRLMDQAAHAGTEKLGEVQRVATAAKEAAAKEAGRQGIAPKTSAKTSTVNEQRFYETPGGPRDLP
jgi:uncharacterized phage infection (PIP) family protein YhgE